MNYKLYAIMMLFDAGLIVYWTVAMKKYGASRIRMAFICMALVGAAISYYGMVRAANEAQFIEYLIATER